MADIPVEYLLRVRRAGDEFVATLSQTIGAHHPEVRCVHGPVSRGHGATAAAAMVSAIAESRVGTVREVSRVD